MQEAPDVLIIGAGIIGCPADPLQELAATGRMLQLICPLSFLSRSVKTVGIPK